MPRILTYRQIIYYQMLQWLGGNLVTFIYINELLNLLLNMLCSPLYSMKYKFLLQVRKTKEKLRSSVIVARRVTTYLFNSLFD